MISNFLHYLDDTILSFFTKFSHKFQVLTGKTNFFLARIFVLFLSALLFVEFANYRFKFLPEKIPKVGFWMVSCFLYLCAPIWLFRLYRADKETEQGIAEPKTFQELKTDKNWLYLRVTQSVILAIYLPILLYEVFCSRHSLGLWLLGHSLDFSMYCVTILYYLSIVTPLTGSDRTGDV